MDHKKSHSRRSKRQSKVTEESHWDCSVCTYRNSAEAFKCMMCDVRKGTSTRKPRINPQLVAQQVAQQYTQVLPKVKKESGGRSESGAGNGGGAGVRDSSSSGTGNAGDTKTVHSKESKTSEKKNTSLLSSSSSSEVRPSRKARPKLKNVDRSSAEHKAVTVNNVTVIITEFQPKRTHNGPPSLASSDGSSVHGGSGIATAATITANGGVIGNKTENGNHSDSTNHSRDSHSDGRSS